MVEAEQVILLRNIVEYVICVMVLAFVVHMKGWNSLRHELFKTYRLRDMMVLRKGSFEQGQI